MPNRNKDLELDIDKLLKDSYRDLSYAEVADIFEYYAGRYKNLANKFYEDD